jgi:hypothetical protein
MLKLEVGKRYLTRAGDIATIESKDEHPRYCFNGIIQGDVMVHSWRPDGKWITTHETRWDLLSEISETEVKILLERG